MKASRKLAVLFLACGLFSASRCFAIADSTTLSSESVMLSTIEQAGDSTPIGLITIWATSDPIPVGWLECNGQAVNADKHPDYVKTFGTHTPDYRGFFLRGHGGKSAGLGEAQDYAAQTNSYSAINMSGMGSATMNYLNGASYANPTLTVVKSGSQEANGVTDVKLNNGSISVGKASRTVLVKMSGQNTTGMSVEINSAAGETRPVNKAVKYIVKVE